MAYQLRSDGAAGYDPESAARIDTAVRKISCGTLYYPWTRMYHLHRLNKDGLFAAMPSVG